MSEGVSRGFFVFSGLTLLGLFLLGCTQFRYVCPDGTVMDDPQQCVLNLPAGITINPSKTPNKVLPKPTLSQGVQATLQPPSTEELGLLEKRILEQINVERSRANLDGLEWSEKAASAARKYAKSLIEEQRFAHTGIDGDSIHDRLRAEGLFEFVANENLAQFSYNGSLISATQVVDGWMKSPGHRSNIIDVDRLYDHAGLGAYCGSEYCVFAYTAVALSRKSQVQLDQNVFTFIFLNDPGYGFNQTIPMRFELDNSTQAVDVFVLPNYAAFETAKSLTASDFANRDFPYIERFNSVTQLHDSVNASVGMGVMVINLGKDTAAFQFKSELAG